MSGIEMWLRAVEARGAAAAQAAAVRAGNAVAVAAADVPFLRVTRDGDDVVLAAEGLRDMAFGSRARAADPRVAGLVAGAGR